MASIDPERQIRKFTSFVKKVARPFRLRTKPGASPGLVKDDPRDRRSRIFLTTYKGDEFEERELSSVDEVVADPDPERVTWIDIEGLGNGSIIKEIGDRFDVHPLALEDTVSVHQRTKVEDYESQLFFVTRAVWWKEMVQGEQVAFVLGSNFLLTFSEGSSDDYFKPLSDRLRKNLSRCRTRKADFLFYSTLDAVIDEYYPVVEAIGDELDQLDEQAMSPQSQGVLAHIHAIRGQLQFLRRTLWSMRDALHVMMNSRRFELEDETKLYLRDCYDHTMQLVEVIETYRELCADLRDAYFAAVSHRTNEIMRVLTIVTTIFVPLSFLAGLYGMNFDPQVSPYNMPELHSKYGYPILLLLMSGVAGGLLVFFWRKGWIGNEKQGSVK